MHHTGRSIVCFSSNDWTDIPSSKFHIMRYLGQHNRVLFVETLGLRSPRASAHDARRVVGKVKRTVRGLRNVENDIYIWSPVAVPYHGVPAVQRLNGRLVSTMVGRLMRQLDMSNPVIWSFLPNAIDVIERLPPGRVVYHCIDDYGEFTDVPRAAFELLEKRMLRAADLTVVSAQRLYDLRKDDARAISYVPHGVNLEEFRASLVQPTSLPDMDAIDGPIAGFVGRIADWIDLDLVARCAREMPDWSFVMVGPSNVDLSAYESVPNLHFTGRCEHELVPHYIQRFDVALMPFARNSVVDSVNPLKMYEYLAVGTPVVTVPMDEIGDFAQVVDIAEPEHFPQAIAAAHASDRPADRERRVQSVSDRSWGAIADRILDDLDSVTEPGAPDPAG